MKKLFLLVCYILSFTLCLAQSDYPIVEKNGKKYYEYTINTGEGLFSIARKFGIKQNDLHEANENLSTNIKAGDKILIPIKNISKEINTEAATIHIVEAKQTLYSISKIYNIPIDTLIALNPSAKIGIKVGEILIISKDKKIQSPQLTSQKKEIQTQKTNTITHIVKRKETLYSISKQYNIAIHDLIMLNPELKNGLKAGETIIIKGENPDNEGINENEEDEKEIESKQEQADVNLLEITYTPNDTTNNNLQNIQITTHTNDSITTIVYLLPLVTNISNEEKNTQRFIEFYRGSIIALNDAKEEGISANVYTYNIPKSCDNIDSILHLFDDKNIDIIIGPAYSNQLENVLSYTKKHNITTIVPFSSKIDSTYFFPKLIQFNPPQDTLFNDVLLESFSNQNHQYILGRFANCKNKGNNFLDNLEKFLTSNNRNFKNITINTKNAHSLISNISQDTTILLLGSTLINDVAPILDSLALHHIPNLTVWGFEEWGINTIKKYPQTIYHSLFNPKETEKYKSSYSNWFGTRKQSVGVKYDLLGYDLTTFALKEIDYNNNDTLSLKPQLNEINFLQTKPSFEFIENRWLNTKYYLLLWDNISIKEINNNK